jgi:hypothetical protein
MLRGFIVERQCVKFEVALQQITENLEILGELKNTSLNVRILV